MKKELINLSRGQDGATGQSILNSFFTYHIYSHLQDLRQFYSQTGLFIWTKTEQIWLSEMKFNWV